MSESKPVLDADAYKRIQHDQWNEDAAAWYRWGPTFQTWFGGVTQKMLDSAQVGPGQRVLDIAGGAGEPALSAAERVGPQGDGREGVRSSHSTLRRENRPHGEGDDGSV